MRIPVRALLTLLLLAAAIGGWWLLSRPQPIAVRVQNVERGLVEEVVANTRAGTVKACRRARLAPGSGGQIETLAVHEGDRVQAGQLLLELWNLDLKARVTLAEREAEAAEARSLATCLQADQAEREAARQVKLEARNMTSEEGLDRAITAAQAGRADCEAARASARVSAAQIGVAQAELERTRLTAPFAGIVAEVSGELNEYVTPSPPGIPTPPAVDLIDDACFYISAPIDEVDAAKVRLGLDARVTLDAFGDQALAGTVRRLAPYVLDQEKQARTVEVEVVIAEPPADRALLAGYSADVEIIIDRHEDVLRIPTAAIRAGEPASVLLLADGVLAERALETGLSNWEQTEVVSGLSAGEQVVLSLGREGVEAGAAAVADDD
ncbi:efflux transporter periplasmic adaptor subunit [Lamprobacter modestohalophilus]|uniref:Efflux transporter periplasmic adaptor subunit n=1 Tax=Lamprobacter modestohalophilus TaxID=1064514 RepID=A0A9X1B3J5_9GAMM|nr:efflux RND transporter periplasmic adaptor subunit [Lamprobacter modestohalophilus]MBK1618059.1 efflux transporter periplasmic adaptor subunit [Lamprobacter modestohalophilus]MCF7978162.1 efflux RND transporter periplasmic adaptor subunit [Chromatiaceae bacterium]MCF7993738.1 efflux RND transporter periplasmic adaptor subunit [Chromatiaceae bacterium]MCF8014457.1 efflux RND transporter periplasmic adaptor subunit [Chromatiaceae bacterium]